ncbi:hypothetical protein BKA70DRAFT_1227678 [Coprinopsis sp. MPI-PUGE-AT-0042]|nr:hypothetical protein BKA70DRAFT_1227678 [Coprinopsis sp. MPI-PUGE-AT-0042]
MFTLNASNSRLASGAGGVMDSVLIYSYILYHSSHIYQPDNDVDKPLSLMDILDGVQKATVAAHIAIFVTPGRADVNRSLPAVWLLSVSHASDRLIDITYNRSGLRHSGLGCSVRGHPELFALTLRANKYHKGSDSKLGLLVCATHSGESHLAEARSAEYYGIHGSDDTNHEDKELRRAAFNTHEGAPKPRTSSQVVSWIPGWQRLERSGIQKTAVISVDKPESVGDVTSYRE